MGGLPPPVNYLPPHLDSFVLVACATCQKFAQRIAWSATESPRSPRGTSSRALEREGRQGACRCRQADGGGQARVRGEITVRLAIAAEARGDALAPGEPEPATEVGILEQAVRFRAQLLGRAEQHSGDPVFHQRAIARDVRGE